LVEIDVQKIDKMDLSPLYEYLDATNLHNMTAFFKADKGEHYKFFAYLSTLLQNSLFFEIGTLCGHSALAMSMNTSNYIISFDVNDSVYPAMLHRKNVKFLVGDYHNELKHLLSAQVVFLDADHDGAQEWNLFKILVQNSFKGLLIVDDLYSYVAVKNFWDRIVDYPKYDLTEYAHGTGTGLIDFSRECKVKFN
jgi:predicted O-methyltransferase YrrM